MPAVVQNRNEPPNGGWGWMVVFGAALINMVNQTMFANFGLIFGNYLKELSGGRATGLTLVMSISVISTNFSGLLVGPLNKIFSVQVITYIGIFCVGGGMIISSFSNAIWQICLAYGIMTGLGLGLIASGTFLAINDWFTTKKSTAVGISMAGTSLGQMLMPVFLGKLLEKFGYHGTALTVGIMCYSGFIGAMLFKPVLCCKKTNNAENTIDDHEAENTNNTQSPSKEDEETTLLDGQKRKPSASFEDSFRDTAIEISSSQQLTTPSQPTDPKVSFFSKTIHAIGFPLLKDPILVNILLGLGFGYVSTISFSTFFPMFLQDEVKFPMIQTTTCMTALSFSDVLGRLTSSALLKKINLGNRGSFMIGAVLLLIARSCMVAMTSYIHVLVASFLVGYFRAITVINQNLVISEYVIKDKLPQAVGLNMVTKALCTSVLGQSLGYIKDMFSYSFCIHLLDIVLCFVVSGFFIEKLIVRMCTKRTSSNKEEESIQQISN